MGPDRPTGKEEQDIKSNSATVQQVDVSNSAREDGPGESVTDPKGEMNSRRESNIVRVRDRGREGGDGGRGEGERRRAPVFR